MNNNDIGASVWAGILLPLAILILYAARSRLGRAIRATPISTATEATAPRSSGRMVALKGTVECGDPLVSDLGETPCVHYSMRVTPSYNSAAAGAGGAQATPAGKPRSLRNTRSVPFVLRDESGTIEVDPAGAFCVDERGFSQFRRSETRGPGEQPGYRIGGYTFDPGSIATPYGMKITGWQFEESAIPVGRVIYVLGEATDTDGRIRIRKPRRRKAPFVVSVKGEDSLLKEARSNSTKARVFAVVLAVVGFLPALILRMQGVKLEGRWGGYVLGVLLLLASLGLLIASSAKRRKLRELRYTETATAGSLAELAGSVAKEMGAGSFVQAAQVQGSVECSEPIVSEVAKVGCVYYRKKVTRHYEGPDEDDDGRPTKHTEVLADRARCVRFQVRDATGTLSVDPEGAVFVAEKIFSRFGQGEIGDGFLRAGEYRVSLDPRLESGNGRTLGFAIEEEGIPVGRQVHVLGEAADDGGTLRLTKPSAKDAQFLISLKSAEQLRGAAAVVIKALSIGVVCALAGALCLTLGALRVF